ncbi:MAG: hypothetical protein QNJ45_01720 [Ardenticatenaceae bacterium]|nr:hypothetical protein [Ardenticatenaceae bacterium]
MTELVTKLQLAQEELNPQFKALQASISALKTAVRLAGEEKPDALPMQKALVKLQVAAAEVDSKPLDAAVAEFAAVTQTALDNLAFDFAKDLRDAFVERDEEVSGRPPTLAIGLFIFEINIVARKGQWFYGKEALTRPIPLSLKGILKAYDRQVRRIGQRETDVAEFVAELRQAWQDCVDKRSKSSGRVNIIEVYAQLILNRQSGRFWNAPARRTFKDYERELFVRDLILAREQGAGNSFRLGVATKSQAEQANRSIWLPETAATGEYYSDIIFG